MLKKQVDEHRLVLWFDPECHYQELVQQLTLPDTLIIQYENSFFALRYSIEPYLNDIEPPRLLVYVPLAPSDTQQALAELQIMAAEMRPGHSSPHANTRLSLLARNVLKPLLGEDTALSCEKQVQAGKLSLADLDTLAERGTGIKQGVVALIFGTGSVQDVALAFLNSDRYDAEIVNKDAGAELATLFFETFDIERIDREIPADYRLRLARYLLATDLIPRLQVYGSLPAHLTSISIATQLVMRQACEHLVTTWRLRRDLAESYAKHAQRVEQELDLNRGSYSLEQLEHIETFLTLEKQLQAALIERLLQDARDEYVKLARTRQSSFWAQYLPEVQANWALIDVTGQVLLEANRIELALKAQPGAQEIFEAYTAKEQPWCQLDATHRHMEQRYHNFHFTLDDHLERLLSRARQRYMQVGSTLAERFLRGLQAERYHLPNVLRQIEIFEKMVRPRLREGKVAYIWVDALRYEMAYELARLLGNDTHLDLLAAQGTVPTITEIGMAALLPDAHHLPRLIASGASKLALELNGTIVKDRKSRLDFLKTHASVVVFDALLDELLPKPIKKVRDGIRNADLVLITSQEIDLLGEAGNTALARKTMDEALRQLQQAFRMLGQLGVKAIICTADHGYLFAEELSDDMKIESPGGMTADLHRRVWVGQGGAADTSYLRIHATDVGLESDLDIAVPWNFACFRVRGGAEAYFHGGMSPQELIIPVLLLAPKKDTTGVPGDIEWHLVPGSQKITARLCSVQISGKATSLFELIPPRVRIEIRSGRNCISLPVSASYGFEEVTGDVQLQVNTQDPQSIEPNTVALAITQDLRKGTVSLHLLDAATGVELSRLEAIELNISI
jgi:hypothetical protein